VDLHAVIQQVTQDRGPETSAPRHEGADRRSVTPAAEIFAKLVSDWKNLLGWLSVAGVLFWSYQSALIGLAARWAKEADYGHGFLVPVFAAVLLWLRWADFRKREFKLDTSAAAVGIVFLVIWAGIRYVASAYYIRLLDPFSILPCLAAVAILAGGWSGFAWAWPSILYLIFMIPLPGIMADWLRHPLQRIATIASTYTLQLLGIPAISQGNVIVLTGGELGVEEACSGLRMMILFFAICVGAACVIRGGWIDRLLVVLSAPFIAVLANIFRISLTGVIHQWAGPEVAQIVFHDFAGWLMAPFAVLVLWLELWIVAQIFPVYVSEGPSLGPVAQPNKNKSTGTKTAERKIRKSRG